MKVAQLKPYHYKLFVFFMILCTSLGGILYGYDIGVISGALLFVKKTIPMTRLQEGVIVGAVLGGGLVGTVITGFIADNFGRRKAIMGACVIFVFGIVSIILAHSFEALLIARLLLGLGVGIIAVAIPLYLAEVAPAKIRGRSVTMFQLFLTFGILLAYLVDFCFTPSGNWRGMFAVLLIPTLLLFVGMLFLPETPRWLLAKQKNHKAHKVLLKTQSFNHACATYRRIKSSFNEHSKSASWKDLFARRLWLPLFVVLSIAVLNQLTGINVLLQYAPVVIEKAGLTSSTGTMLGTIGIGAVNFFGTVVALFLVDFFGRKRLLLLGTGGIIVAYLYLGLLSGHMQHNQLAAELSMIGLVGYILFYAIGPGVVVWLVISELLPTEIRGKAVALGLFVNTLTATILSTVFLSITHWLSLGGVYELFAIFTLLYFLVGYFFLPETKQKTLEEIQRIYRDDNITESTMLKIPIDN